MSVSRAPVDTGRVFKQPHTTDVNSILIEEVASRLYSTSDWLEQFGGHYGLTKLHQVSELCSAERSSARTKSCLPPGWDTRRLGKHWLIFYNANPEADEIDHVLPHPYGWPHNALPMRVVRALREAAGRKLAKGEQKVIASDIGVTESTASRVIKFFKLLPADAEVKPVPHPARLGVAGIDGYAVDAVFKVLMTVKEWHEHVGSKRYGISSAEYVQDMASERVWGNSTVPAKLPDGWLSVRVGTSYLIYHHTIGTKTRWIRAHK